MGHVRLGNLPKSRKWQQVIDLLEGEAGLPEIAAASSAAAEASLLRVADDPALVRAVWLLTQIPLAARRHDFPDRLLALGLSVGREPSLMELAGAFSDAVDGHVRRIGRRTDLGEMAQLAATESLVAVVGRDLPGLFGSAPEDVRRVLGRLATRRGFSVLARDFFARLTRRHLDYFLSRELSNHVGPQRRLRTIADQSDFNAGLDRHCRETARIVKEFSGDWFSKANFEGGIGPKEAGRFAHVAFGKIRRELRKRRDADD